MFGRISFFNSIMGELLWSGECRPAAVAQRECSLLCAELVSSPLYFIDYDGSALRCPRVSGGSGV